MSAYDDDIPGLPATVVDVEMGDAEVGLPSLLPLRNKINWTCEKGCGEGVEAPFQYSPAVQKAIESILYIADHIKKQDDEHSVTSSLSFFFPFHCSATA